jgi:hypothetical protein
MLSAVILVHFDQSIPLMTFGNERHGRSSRKFSARLDVIAFLEYTSSDGINRASKAIVLFRNLR